MSASIKYGQIWSSPAGAFGIGGNGQSVTLGEFTFNSPLPEQVTLTLGKRQSGRNTLAGAIYADVVYGVGTATSNVSLDWQQGTTIGLPAGKITVTARQVGSWDASVILTAQVAPGPKNSVSSPTLTETFAINPAGSIGLAVPARAKRIQISDPLGAASDMIVQVAAMGAGSNYTVATDPIIRTYGVILSGQADTVIISSVAGVPTGVATWILDG